jgi:hypothetical protein
MEGLYYLASVVAIFLVVLWYIANSKVKPGEPTHGLLEMKEPRDKEKAAAQARIKRRQGRKRWTSPSDRS